MTALAAAPAKPSKPPRLSRVTARFAPLLRRYGWANLVLAAAIAIPVVANAVLLAGYAIAANDRAWLSRQVQEVQHRVDERLNAPQPVATPASSAAVVFPEEIESADMMDLVLKLAQESAVELVAVDERGVSTQRVGEREYHAYRYSVRVRARVSQLVAFLNRLEQAQQRTLAIGSVSSTPQAGQSWVVTVELIAYAAPGP